MMLQMAAHWFRSVIPAMFLFLLVPMASEAKVYLVSVGISDYPGTGMDLRAPVYDAKTIAWVYSKNTKMQYSMLLDEDATRTRVIAAMDKVFSMANANDIVVFYFSGHGYKGGFCVYDGCISYHDVRKSMSLSKCRNKMIFADACFSGNIRENGSVSQYEENEARKANVMLFLSSRGNEISVERSDMANGMFTAYLQRGLRGGADKDRNRIITALELFSYVNSRVSSVTGGLQHPVMWGKFPDNMPVMIWK